MEVKKIENLKEGTELRFNISGGNIISPDISTGGSEEVSRPRITSGHVFSNKITIFIIIFLSILIIVGISLKGFLYRKNK